MSLKATLRTWLERIAPGPTQVLQAIRARRHVNRLQRAWGITAINERYVAARGATVIGGPFKGLKFGGKTTWSNLVSKLVGAYELELNEHLERLFQNEYQTAVDVGCADGYFAIGMALRLPRTTVYPFDLDPMAQRVVRAMAAGNGVADRVHVRGRCDPPVLQSLITGRRSLVFSDCEGYEMILMDPAAVPALRDADIVIEFHDDIVPGVTDAVLSRFQRTHEIERIFPSPRRASDFPSLDFLGAADAEKVLSENRSPGQSWGVLTARSSNETASGNHPL
jgi:hypothetical protein